MSKLKLLLVVFVTMLAVGCASTNQAKVNFDRNTQVSIIEYKTFAWLKESKLLSAPAGLNPITKVRIDEAIEASFKAQGYQLIEDADSADFAISYTLGSRDKIRVDSFPSHYRGGFGWGRGYYGGTMVSDTTVRQYTEGKLAIDVFDVKSRQPVWHGWAVKRISSKKSEDPDALVRAIVDQVVAQFK